MSDIPTTTRKQHRLHRVLIAVPTYAAYGRRIVDGVLEFADKNPGWEFERSREPEELYTGQQPDGVIRGISTGPLGKTIARFEKKGTPCVSVTDPALPLPQVLMDDVAVGEMAAGHFLDLGFEQLGFLSYTPYQFACERLEGFTRAARRSGAMVHTLPLSDNGSLTMSVEKWLGELPLPIGILAAEDMTAVHLANACQEQGVMVPQQVAIIGVDNDTRACRMANPPLSSIDHGAREVGFRAAQLLENLMAGQAPPDEPIYVQPRGIITRQSTNTLAIEDPNVARAVRYIHDRFAERITPGDVVAAIPVARRTLETAFRRCLGRTILQELQRVRIDRVKHLLRETDLAMPEICELSGFSSPSRLSKAFKKAVGHPPSHYRSQSRL
ncbi:MAG: substrate-binding domain-containing protein [Planctomycetota bacterium]